MRIALLFTFFLSLSSSLVTAIHNSHFARRDLKPRSDVLTSRQHRIRRDLLDICINVNINLLADASKLLGLGSLLGPLGLSSDIQLCLCLKVNSWLFLLNFGSMYAVGLLTYLVAPLGSRYLPRYKRTNSISYWTTGKKQCCCPRNCPRKNFYARLRTSWIRSLISRRSTLRPSPSSALSLRILIMSAVTPALATMNVTVPTSFKVAYVSVMLLTCLVTEFVAISLTYANFFRAYIRPFFLPLLIDSLGMWLRCTSSSGRTH